MRDVITTKEGPQAIGPYSQAIRANGFVFVSGQVAIDPANHANSLDRAALTFLRGFWIED